MPRKPSQKPQDGDSEDISAQAASEPENAASEPEKRPQGRPSKFTPEMRDLICQRICDGESVREICRDPEMPHMATVFRWLSEDLAFSEQYARATKARSEFIAEDILDIADDGTNDWMERKDKDGAVIGWQENGEAIQRSRLRVDTRKWLLSKLIPKKYGDKLEIEQNTTIKQAVDEEALQAMDSEELAAMSAMLDRAMAGKAVN